MGRLADWLFGTVTSPPEVTAAAGGVALARPAGDRSTANVPWGFGPPLAGFEAPEMPPWWDRSSAMSLPTISRCRDLICSAVGALPLTAWAVDVTAVPTVVRQIAMAPWMVRPDPDRTRQWLLAWTVDDLLFNGAAHWRIVDRYVDTYPRAFRRISPGNLTPSTEAGMVTVSDEVTGRQEQVPTRDIVEFLSPIEGLLSNGWRAISIAMQLDGAADRFAGTEVPAGVLEEQEGGEDLSAAELAEQADTFTAARRANITAAVNKYLRYKPTDIDASKMQLVEGRTYQALELARLGNVPPYLVGAPSGTGMTYQNGQQARQDLIDFGALPYVGCIEQTLSGPNVTPRGQAVRLDLDAWLRNPFTDGGDPTSPHDLQIADPGARA